MLNHCNITSSCKKRGAVKQHIHIIRAVPSASFYFHVNRHKSQARIWHTRGCADSAVETPSFNHSCNKAAASRRPSPAPRPLSLPSRQRSSGLRGTAASPPSSRRAAIPAVLRGEQRPLLLRELLRTRMAMTPYAARNYFSPASALTAPRAPPPSPARRRSPAAAASITAAGLGLWEAAGELAGSEVRRPCKKIKNKKKFKKNTFAPAGWASRVPCRAAPPYKKKYIHVDRWRRWGVRLAKRRIMANLPPPTRRLLP